MNGEDMNKESLYKKGLSRFQHGYPEEALKIVNDLLILDPNYSEALKLKDKIEDKLRLKAMRSASSASEAGLNGDHEKLFEFIKKESSGKVLKYLFGFSVEETNSEFYTLVGKTLTINPEFFMRSLYKPFRKRISRIYGNERRREIERFIISKCCLYDEEQILYECEGSIKIILAEHYNLKVAGYLYFTNRRIIAEGAINAKLKSTSTRPTASEVAFPTITILKTFAKPSRTDHIDAKREMIYSSIREELPCYGFIFPIKELYDIILKKHSITYKIKQYNNLLREELRIMIFTHQALDKIYEILFKNQR